jgi:hypothetical protein
MTSEVRAYRYEKSVGHTADNWPDCFEAEVASTACKTELSFSAAVGITDGISERPLPLLTEQPKFFATGADEVRCPRPYRYDCRRGRKNTARATLKRLVKRPDFGVFL